MTRAVLFAAAVLLAAGTLQAQTLDGRLKRIAETKTLSIAYRADAVPFSFAGKDGQPEGFSIELCKRVASAIESQLKIQGLKLNWVPVTVQSRFDAVAKGQADMECGSSTMTLARMRQVDFSNVIFVESTGLLVKSASGVRTIGDLSGKTIAVVVGTTNERAVGEQLARRQISAKVVPFSSRDEAFAALEGDKADAFASDKLLLLGVASKSKDPRALAMLAEDLSFEPYGIVLPRGDASLRLAVNAGLARIFRGDEVVEVYRRWFGQLGRPSMVLEAAYILGSIPE
jgi:glutamate/aspartate transport system substrate-binding protein